jgi:hypothetical protein
MYPEPVKKPSIQNWHPMLALEMEDFCRDFNAIKWFVDDGVDRRKISRLQGDAVMRRWDVAINEARASAAIHVLSEAGKDPEFPDVRYEPSRSGCNAIARALNGMLEELCQSFPGRRMVEVLANHRSISLAGQILAMRILVPEKPERDLSGPGQ